MIDSCYPDDQIAEIARLTEDDPRRSHLSVCTRCRTSLASYMQFIRAPGDDVEGLDQAQDALRAALAEAIARERDSTVSKLGPKTDAPAPARTSWLRLLDPDPRLAWAAVATVIVLGGTWLVLAPRLGGEHVWRGQPVAGKPTLELRMRAPSRSGPVAFDWNRVPGATSYVIRISREDLTEIAVLDAADATHYDLDPARISGAPPPPGTVLVQIEARRSGDPIALSRTVAVELR